MGTPRRSAMRVTNDLAAVWMRESEKLEFLEKQEALVRLSALKTLAEKMGWDVLSLKIHKIISTK